MKQTEKIRMQIANQNGFKNWAELITKKTHYLHICTTEAMQIAAVRFHEWIKDGNAHFYNEQYARTDEELFKIWNES